MIAVTRFRAATVAAAVSAALFMLWTAAAQQEPPFRYYGNAGTVEPGDVVSATDQFGRSLGSAEAGADGAWHLDVDRDNMEGVAFTLNGEPTEAAIRSTGAGQAEVTLTVILVEENSTIEDNSLTDEGRALDEDEIVDEVGALDEEPELTFPNSGTGGPGDAGVSTAALLGALAALLVAVALGGLAMRRYVSSAK
jgi:hypothetical protein